MRKGLGKGMGMGYKNLVPKDPYVHSMSAKGVRQLNMMGLAEINRLNREASRKAMHKNTKPFMIKSKAQIENMPPFPFPYIGEDYVPEGYKKTNEYFVDSSGFGADDELALSVRQFLDKIEIGKAYAITSAGQFQVYVSEFEPTGEKVKHMYVPNYTNIDIGRAFKEGKTKGKSNSMDIVDRPNETLLVGYGWAVYGARNKKTGKITFFKGWDGYSPTTSKQLSQTGLRGADIVLDKRPEVSDY